MPCRRVGPLLRHTFAMTLRPLGAAMCSWKRLLLRPSISLHPRTSPRCASWISPSMRCPHCAPSWHAWRRWAALQEACSSCA